MSVGRGLVLGCVTNCFEGSYQQAVLHGFVRAGLESDVSVVCFVGDSPSDDPDRSSWLLKHPIFRLIGKESLDGLMVPISIINNAGFGHVEEFLAQFGTVPRCYLGLERAFASSVISDNDIGMRAAIEHLIRVHGYRRIAFVRGPVGNDEADRRFAVYQRVLLEHDIAIDPKLVLIGEFNLQSGRRAAEQLFEGSDGRSLNVQAVVAANDPMALGFMSYLEAHRIRCPDVLALVGYDDVYEARLARAPLTTVRQPLSAQGREAANLLLRQLRGEPASKSVMKTELVVRRSCGCFANLEQFHVEPATTIGQNCQFDAALLEQRQRIQLELLRAGLGNLAVLGAGWEGRLLSALVQELKGERDAFRRLLDEMLLRLFDAKVDPSLFHGLISVLWQRVLPCTLNNVELRTGLEGLLDCARMAVCAAGQRALGAESVRTGDYSARVIELSMAVAAAESIEEIASILGQQLGGFGIEHFDLAEFEGQQNADQLRLRYTFAKGQSDLLRASIDGRQFVRYCLHGRSRAGMYMTGFGRRNRFQGLIAMDIDEHDAPLLNALRSALGTAASRGVFG